MKKIVFSLIALISLGVTAQELPAPSPAATIEQRVGLTDIKIEYSRPSMKGRVIFGDLVPFDELWRTGANKVPNITFSTHVNFAGTQVEAGTYSLLTIPSEDRWTVILNEDTELYGTGNYDAAKNVLSVEVPSGEGYLTESFTFDINSLTTNSASINMMWDKMVVMIPITVEVQEVAIANIEKAIAEAGDDDGWRVYRNAAGYYFNNKIDMDKALEYVNQSIEMNESSWYSHWMKAEILAETGDYKGALKSGKESMKVGKAEAEAEEKEFTYAEMVQEGMDEWAAMKKKS